MRSRVSREDLPDKIEREVARRGSATFTELKHHFGLKKETLARALRVCVQRDSIMKVLTNDGRPVWRPKDQKARLLDTLVTATGNFPVIDCLGAQILLDQNSYELISDLSDNPQRFGSRQTEHETRRLNALQGTSHTPTRRENVIRRIVYKLEEASLELESFLKEETKESLKQDFTPKDEETIMTITRDFEHGQAYLSFLRGRQARPVPMSDSDICSALELHLKGLGVFEKVAKFSGESIDEKMMHYLRTLHYWEMFDTIDYFLKSFGNLPLTHWEREQLVSLTDLERYSHRLRSPEIVLVYSNKPFVFYEWEVKIQARFQKLSHEDQNEMKRLVLGQARKPDLTSYSEREIVVMAMGTLGIPLRDDMPDRSVAEASRLLRRECGETTGVP